MEQKKLYLFLLIAVVITLLTGMLYITIQQDLRLGANDPQIQMAEDTAVLLQKGSAPQLLIPQEQIDMRQSLAPFMIIYDKTGKSLASSALLDGQMPQLPAGVLASVQTKGEERLTWQPKSGVRSAIVVTKVSNYPGGYVLAGRSLREIEVRENQLLVNLVIGWAMTLLSSFVLSIYFFNLKKQLLQFISCRLLTR